MIWPLRTRIASTVSKMNLPTGGRHTQEWALMRPVVGLVRGYKIAVSGLPMDFRMKIGKCYP
jgi:hypothetical protein